MNHLSLSSTNYHTNPIPFPISSTKTPKHKLFLLLRPNYRPNRPIFRVHSSADQSGSEDSPWLRLSESILRGSNTFFKKFGESVKKETGFDVDVVNSQVFGFFGRAKEVANEGQAEFNSFRTRVLPQFIEWNKWDRWKVNFFIYFYM